MAYLKRSQDTVTKRTSDSPILTTPALGTPASGVATNLTSIPATDAADIGAGVLPSDVTGGAGLTATNITGACVKITSGNPGGWQVNNYSPGSSPYWGPDFDITMTSGNRVLVSWSVGLYRNGVGVLDHTYTGISGTGIQDTIQTGNRSAQIVNVFNYRHPTADTYGQGSGISYSDVINATSAEYQLFMVAGSGVSGTHYGLVHQQIVCMEIQQ